MEECKKEYEVKVARLEEQRGALGKKIREQESLIQMGQQEFSNKITHMEEEYAKEMRKIEEQMDSLSHERNNLIKELEEAKSDTQVLHVKLQAVQVEASGLHKELLEARLPSQAHLREVAELKARIAVVEKERDVTEARSKTLVLRYETGDLVSVSAISEIGDSEHDGSLTKRSFSSTPSTVHLSLPMSNNW